MTNQPFDQPEHTLHDLFELAVWFWEDGTRLCSVRTQIGISKEKFANVARITVQRVNRYEQEGRGTGNFWLFCNHLESVIINNPDDWERFLDDPGDRMRGGKIDQRDKRYAKPKKFWRWAEDEKKDETSRRTGREIPREDVERWFDEWVRKNKPDGWGRDEIRPIE